MMLPKIDVPTYTIRIPSSGKEITIRPFLVKEEKLLLMAAKTDDENEIIHVTKQIVNNCIVSEDVNIEQLPFFDIDFIFIALRAKSIGEHVDVNYRCTNEIEDTVCGQVFPVKIDVSNTIISKDDSIPHSVDLGKGIQIKMKYPNYTTMKQLSEKEDNLEKRIKIIAACIDQVIDKKKVLTSKDFTKEELYTFIEGLTQEQFQLFAPFIDNFPTFVIEAKAKCPKCGFVHTIVYDSFSDFFF